MEDREEKSIIEIKRDDKYISEEIRQYLIKKIKFQIFTKFHVITFIIINLLLFLINNIEDPGSYQWWLWVVTGWGLLVFYNLYFHFRTNPKDFISFHTFTWLIMSFYMLFVDYYSDERLSWVYIPIIGWSLIIILQFVFKREVDQIDNKLAMLALLIADDVGRTLISVEQTSDVLKKIMELSNEKIELTAMFLNAIQQFSNEINLKDIRDLNLSAANLKLISLNSEGITFTGFFLPETPSKVAKIYLKKIASVFVVDFKHEINKFSLVGNSELFESRKEEIQQYLRI